MGTLQQSLTQALTHPPPGMEDLQVLDARLQPLQPLLRALRINPDGRLLVVCPRARTLDDDVLDAQRVVVWSEPQVYQAKLRMPPDVVAVVFTQMPGHRGTGNTITQARAQGAQVWHATITPRTVRELCITAGLISTDEPEPAPAPPPAHTTRAPAAMAPARKDITTKAGHTRMGVLGDFMREQATLEPVAPHTTTKEIDRLAQLAVTLGVPTTRGSIAECFYSMRRALRDREGTPPTQQMLAARKPRGKRKRTQTDDAPAVDTPESVTVKAVHAANVMREAQASVALDGQTFITDAPAPAAAPVQAITSTTPAPGALATSSTTSLDADLANLDGLVDDAMAALALVKDQLAVIRPRITSVFTSASEMQSLRAKLNRIEQALMPDSTGEQHA